MIDSLGENIKNAREAAGLTQEQLGALAGVTGVAIMRYEKGQREPRSAVLLKIAQALGVDVYSLADFDTATQLLEGSMNAKLERLSPKEQALIIAFDQLNDAGQDVAIERVNELTELEKYKNAPSD